MEKKQKKIIEKEIAEEMKSAYIDYAMSVIVSRAIPDVRDGLKPVQRRILYTMYEMGLKAEGKFRKCAGVVGECMAKYHPHGDAPIYEALVRMAQDFTLRYPLIKGQGNFGSIDGDPPAAQRYTECKLSKIGQEMLRDIEKETVDFLPNYDGTRKEPQLLPSPLPQLLLNGALGIAVGMATSIPPHNLREVCDAIIYFLDHPKASIEDLFKFIQGPDFPTGGFIFDKEAIIRAYSQGRGAIVCRAKAQIVEGEKGKKKILITEIPYQVQKSQLLEEIAKLVTEKRIEGIKSIRDESDREGLRITIELKKDVNAERILNLLYKHTQLQKNFYLNMVALSEGIEPKVFNLVDILKAFVDHRKEIIKKRTKYELKKARERLHILNGLKKCLGKIERVIKIIKASRNREMARKNLMRNFKLDRVQAEAILETKLATLARMETKKILEEAEEKEKEIKRLEKILKSEKLIKEEMKKELKDLKEKYGDERRTKVVKEKIGEIKEEELIPPEENLILLTKRGYIKRMNEKEYRVQRRGGKGVLGTKSKEDIVEHFVLANTRDNLLVFVSSGKVFSLPVYEIPKEKRNKKGKPISTFLEIKREEKILSLTPLKKEKEYLIFLTKNGKIKKTKISDFSKIRKSGLIAIRLRKGDVLKSVKSACENDLIFIFTKKGQGILFKEKEIRKMGRNAEGVIGIRLKKGDQVAGMEILPQKMKNLYLLTITENGFGKKTSLREYRIQKRGGKGIKIAKISKKSGNLVCAKVIKDEKNLILISEKGKVLKTKVSSIPKLSRVTRGVKLMELKEDKIVNANLI